MALLALTLAALVSTSTACSRTPQTPSTLYVTPPPPFPRSVITESRPHRAVVFVCDLMGVVCIRPRALADLGTWIGNMRRWALTAYFRCSSPKAVGSFGDAN